MPDEAERMTAVRFGGILYRARQAAGLTMPQVAEAIGRGVSTCRNYENGNSVPDAATVYKLGELLGLTESVVTQAQDESRRRRAHHSFLGCPSARSREVVQPEPAPRCHVIALSHSEQISAIAWEAKRLGTTFDAVRQMVDSQGGGDIYRRFMAWRKERQAEERQAARGKLL